MASVDPKNLHASGLTPSIGNVQALGFDVRFQETYNGHRMYQAVELVSGDLVGDGETDDNYLYGFYTRDFAIVWLIAQTDYTDALTAAGGVTDSGYTDESSPVFNTDGDITGTDAHPTPGEMLARA